MAGATTCPECGKRVSAFAAGCVCGADLEAYARQRRLHAVPDATRRSLPRPSFDRWPLSAAETIYLALTVFAVVWLSVLGIVLGLFGVLHGHYEDRRGWMAVCGTLALAGLALELSRL